MKLIIPPLIWLFFISCQSAPNSPEQNHATSLPASSSSEINHSMEQTPTHQQSPALKFQYYRDKKSGLIQSRAPLPSDWLMYQETNTPYFITGPDGIKVSHPKFEEYVFSRDPYTLQTLQLSGKQISPVYSLDQIIEQSFKPSAAAQGYTFIRSYPIPEVEAFWQKFSAGMPRTGTHRSHSVMGCDWKDAQGNHSMMILVQSIYQNDASIFWNLQTTELEAPESRFADAKAHYIHGLANTEINPQWQQYMNGQLIGQIQQNNAFWAQKTQESARAHQQRMSAIQARGQASRAIGNTYSEILDINHSGYLNRSSLVDAGQARTVNMIGEHVIINNQSTGERYKVDDGSKFYWVNKDGEYFGTDNSLYDPRIDNKINGQEWSRFEVEK